MIKKLLFSLFLTFSIAICFGQTQADTEDYIIEQIQSNSPIPSYKNAIFFKNILQSDAERIGGKKFSQDELSNLFIYLRDCYLDDNRTNWGWTVAQIIDIRDIYKVSTVKTTEKFSYYTITVYVRGNYYAKEYESLKTGKKDWKYLDKMQILISDNLDAAQKIKKAIIHLGELKNTTIKDGELF